jgi:hypothetical protein
MWDCGVRIAEVGLGKVKSIEQRGRRQEGVKEYWTDGMGGRGQ